MTLIDQADAVLAITGALHSGRFSYRSPHVRGLYQQRDHLVEEIDALMAKVEARPGQRMKRRELRRLGAMVEVVDYLAVRIRTACEGR